MGSPEGFRLTIRPTSRPGYLVRVVDSEALIAIGAGNRCGKIGSGYWTTNPERNLTMTRMFVDGKWYRVVHTYINKNRTRLDRLLIPENHGCANPPCFFFSEVITKNDEEYNWTLHSAVGGHLVCQYQPD